MKTPDGWSDPRPAAAAEESRATEPDPARVATQGITGERHAPTVEPPAVLVVYFNRPDVLRQNLRALAELKPQRLFLASDGPRPDRPSDGDKIRQCRSVVAEEVTWPCQIAVLEADRNHGCDQWVPRSISWFLDAAGEGIILEDDCIIGPDFYRFAAQMLDRYRHDADVMAVSGMNFQKQRWGDGDYYFSRYVDAWGWATWSRAWRHYDAELGDLDALLATGLRCLKTAGERRFWKRHFRAARKGKSPFWDGKWQYALFKAGGWAIAPNANLVVNIGFGEDATHTTGASTTDMTLRSLPETLTHPAGVREHFPAADAHWFDGRVRPTFHGRVLVALRRVLNRLRPIARQAEH